MMHADKPAAARKDSHLDLALDPGTRSGGENGFDRVSFTHCALPEVSLSAIDLSTEFLGYQLKAPLMIGAMTKVPMQGWVDDRASFIVEWISLRLAEVSR